MKTVTSALALLATAFLLSACEPEIGSEEWCQQIKDKGAENVTAKEAADYAKHCVF